MQCGKSRVTVLLEGRPLLLHKSRAPSRLHIECSVSDWRMHALAKRRSSSPRAALGCCGTAGGGACCGPFSESDSDSLAPAAEAPVKQSHPFLRRRVRGAMASRTYTNAGRLSAQQSSRFLRERQLDLQAQVPKLLSVPSLPLPSAFAFHTYNTI